MYRFYDDKRSGKRNAYDSYAYEQQSYLCGFYPELTWTGFSGGFDVCVDGTEYFYV